MRRFNLGLTLLVLVVAILVVAPTVVFGYLWGLKAVLAHWAWVALLAGLTFLGVMLVFTGRPQTGQPNPRGSEERLRFRLGMLSFALVAVILVFAPTVVFGYIFGLNAVVAHWAAVILLGVMTFVGLFLIFTDKGQRQSS